MIIFITESWNFIKLKLWVWQIAVLKPLLFYAILKKKQTHTHLERIYMMYFLVLKKTFVIILTLVSNLLSWSFHKVKIIKLKGYPSIVNLTVNHNVLLNNYLWKKQKQFFWHAINSLGFTWKTENGFIWLYILLLKHRLTLYW